MRIARFLTDSATWIRGGTRDAYGRTTGETSSSIDGRWLHSTELVRGDDGQEIVSTAQFSTAEEVRVGDVLVDERGVEREVILVTTAQDVRGNFSHYVVRLTPRRGP